MVEQILGGIASTIGLGIGAYGASRSKAKYVPHEEITKRKSSDEIYKEAQDVAGKRASKAGAKAGVEAAAQARAGGASRLAQAIAGAMAAGNATENTFDSAVDKYTQQVSEIDAANVNADNQIKNLEYQGKNQHERDDANRKRSIYNGIGQGLLGLGGTLFSLSDKEVKSFGKSKSMFRGEK